MSACFEDPDPVSGPAETGADAGAGSTESSTGGTADAVSGGSAAPDDDGAGGSTAAVDDKGSSDGDSSEGEASAGIDGPCVCGIDPEFGAAAGAWCGIGLEPLPAGACPVDIAQASGQPCDSIDPPLGDAGCCMGTDIAVCDSETNVIFFGACDELFEPDCG